MKIVFVEIVLIILVLLVALLGLPALENNATNKFNNTFSALKQNIDITFKYSNMTEEDKINYKNNSCDIIFDHSNYREGDAELCKLKIR